MCAINNRVKANYAPPTALLSKPDYQADVWGWRCMTLLAISGLDFARTCYLIFISTKI